MKGVARNEQLQSATFFEGSYLREYHQLTLCLSCLVYHLNSRRHTRRLVEISCLCLDLEHDGIEEGGKVLTRGCLHCSNFECRRHDAEVPGLREKKDEEVVCDWSGTVRCSRVYSLHENELRGMLNSYTVDRSSLSNAGLSPSEGRIVNIRLFDPVRPKSYHAPPGIPGASC
jgi:hypothetical protein